MAVTLFFIGFLSIGLAVWIGNVKMILDGTHPFLRYPFSP